MLLESLKLTIVGMVFVYFFLTLMIWAMKLMSLWLKGEETEDEQVVCPDAGESNVTSESDDRNIVAVLSAAIRKFQSKDNK